MPVYFPDNQMPTCGFRVDSKGYKGDIRNQFTESPTISIYFNGLNTWISYLCGKPATLAYSGADHVDPGGSCTWKSYRCAEHPERTFTGSSEGGFYEVVNGCWFDGYIKPLSQKPPSLWQRLKTRFGRKTHDGHQASFELASGTSYCHTCEEFIK